VVISGVKIENGLVSDHGYSVHLHIFSREARPFNTYGFELIGDIGTSETPRRRGIDPYHPTYAISWPSGCYGCTEISVSFTPAASPSDVHRLSQVNFSCLTRWLEPCRERADIMPAAWAEAEKDRKSNSAN